MHIDSLRETVFAAKPALKKLVETYGNVSLFDYAKNRFHAHDSTIPERKEEFLNFITTYTDSHFWDVISHQVQQSLRKEYCVSTAEHHGPIGHPFFFQSAILRGLVQPDNAIVQFCASQVSLGNSSYPRWLLFHGDGTEKPLHTLTLPLFGSKNRMSPVYGLCAYSEENIEQYTLNHLHEEEVKYLVSPKQKRFLWTIIEKILRNELILRKKTYSEQITLINSLLWVELFWENLPPLICLDTEDLVKELLLILLEKKWPLHELILNIQKAPLVEKYFEWISCCFETWTHRGTYLFWYLDKENSRHALWRKEDVLEDDSSSYRVELSQEAITKWLREHTIIPSGLLVYVILNCYYGMTCFGGFSQWTYLKQIQKAYSQLEIDPLGNEKLGNNPTDILCEDMVFSFWDDSAILTALDMLYNPDFIHKDRLLLQAKKQTITSSIDAMLPEIVRCL